MSPAALLSPLFLFLLTISFYLSAAQSEVHDSSSYGNGSPCPVPDDGDMTCPVNCLRYQPVCGENGVTYGCGCPDAACAGVRVVKIGPCDVCNGGSGLLPTKSLLSQVVWLIVLGAFVLCGFLSG